MKNYTETAKAYLNNDRKTTRNHLIRKRHRADIKL